MINILALSLDGLDVSQFGTGATPWGLIQNQQLTANNFYIGNANRGTYQQYIRTSIGTALYVGNTASGGAFEQHGSVGAPLEFVGYGGVGDYDQASGTNTATTALYVGYGAFGTYEMAADLHTPLAVIGDYSNGTLTQTAGTTTFYNLQVGSYSSGSYVMNSPDGVNTNQIEIGTATGGTGVFTQKQGDVIVTAASGYGGDVFVGESPNAASGNQYLLQGGELEVQDLNVGHGTSGLFNQSGGSEARVYGTLNLGGTATGQGSYIISGGSVPGANYENIGVAGSGQFTQNDPGSTNNIRYALVLGVSAGSTGYYELERGRSTRGARQSAQTGLQG